MILMWHSASLVPRKWLLHWYHICDDLLPMAMYLKMSHPVMRPSLGFHYCNTFVSVRTYFRWPCIWRRASLWWGLPWGSWAVSSWYPGPGGWSRGRWPAVRPSQGSPTEAGRESGLRGYPGQQSGKYWNRSTESSQVTRDSEDYRISGIFFVGLIA